MSFSSPFNAHGDSGSRVPALIEEANGPVLSAAAKSASGIGRSDLGFLLGV